MEDMEERRMTDLWKIGSGILGETKTVYAGVMN